MIRSKAIFTVLRVPQERLGIMLLFKTGQHASTFCTIAIFAACNLAGQTLTRRASLTGVNANGDGKCTIEVMVDISAEVAITADLALLRTLNGRLAEWRRFECSAAVPATPIDFRFLAIDGRGRQTLMSDPRTSGAAVVRIDDPANGAVSYTFEISWKGTPNVPVGNTNTGFRGTTGVTASSAGSLTTSPQSNTNPSAITSSGSSTSNFDVGSITSNNAGTTIRTTGNLQGSTIRRVDERITAEDAIRACEDSIAEQALNRLGAQVIVIRNSHLASGFNRGDEVSGLFDAKRGQDWDRYQFACAVDFATSRLGPADYRPLGWR